MKKIYWLVLATTVAIAGCGKAEISSDCSLNGQGEYKCNFKNKGNAKGSSCEHLVLRANPGFNLWFRIYFDNDIFRYAIEPNIKNVGDALKKTGVSLAASSADIKNDEKISQEMKAADASGALVRKQIEKIMQSVKSSGEHLDKYIADHRVALAVQIFGMDRRGLSQTEVCSGIVEAGDVKEVNGLALFGSEGLSPVDACFNPYGDRKWSDACSFTTVAVAEIDKIVKAKLESTSSK